MLGKAIYSRRQCLRVVHAQQCARSSGAALPRHAAHRARASAVDSTVCAAQPAVPKVSTSIPATLPAATRPPGRAQCTWSREWQKSESPASCTSAAAASSCSQTPASHKSLYARCMLQANQDSYGAKRVRRRTSTDVQSATTSSSEAPPARALQLRSRLSRMQWEGQPCTHGCQAVSMWLPLGRSSLSKQPGRSPRQPLLQAYRLRQVISASSGCPAGTEGRHCYQAQMRESLRKTSPSKDVSNKRIKQSSVQVTESSSDSLNPSAKNQGGVSSAPA